MMKELKLEPVQIDGCAVGVRSKPGEPILKPWRIAVSSKHMKQALDGLRCQGATSTFLALEAGRLARPSTPNSFATLFMTAWTHMSRRMPCRLPGHISNHVGRWCQVACLFLESACVLQAVASAPPVIASALIALQCVREINPQWVQGPQGLNPIQETNPRRTSWTSPETNIKRLLSLVPRCLDLMRRIRIGNSSVLVTTFMS